MDFGERGNYCKQLNEDRAIAVIREKIAAKKEWLKRQREEKGLAENACLYCGNTMEERRLKLDLPDCEECRRERNRNSPSVEMVAVL